jgi:hypothetical protein
MTIAASKLAAPMYDGIFSLVPGKFALFYFHEGEVFLFSDE